MSLDKSLAKTFAKTINDFNKSSNNSTYTYGVVKKHENDVYVLIDGSDVEMPVVSAMDSEDGDRVLVSILDHTATIVGNISSPASARTATSYMKFTEEGLVIGHLKDGRPISSYCLIANDGYYILNEDGNILAKFLDNELSLGESSDSIVNLCDKKAQIVYSDGDFKGDCGLSIASVDNLYSSTELLSVKGDSYEKLADPFTSYAMVNTSVSGVTNNPVVFLCAKGSGRKLNSNSSEIIMQRGKIDIHATEINFCIDENLTDSDAKSLVKINDATILTNDKPLFKTGTVSYSDSIGNSGDSYKVYSKEVSVPSGYTLVGITAVNNIAHRSAQQLTSFYYSGNTVYAWYHFTSNVSSIGITWSWLAIRDV